MVLIMSAARVWPISTWMEISTSCYRERLLPIQALDPARRQQSFTGMSQKTQSLSTHRSTLPMVLRDGSGVPADSTSVMRTETESWTSLLPQEHNYFA